MARPRHPNKDIEAAVEYAENRGWRWRKASDHAWGVLLCPLEARGGHRISVNSTPANPFNHARRIRQVVNKCTH